METSLLKTLACKHKSSLMQMYKKLKTTVQTEDGPRRAIVVMMPREGKAPLITQFGGLLLHKSDKAILTDSNRRPYIRKRTELIKRLLAEECEICGSTENIQVHHVRKLADLQIKGRREKPMWMQIMSARRRKTLVVCRECHWDIHTGRPLKRKSA